MSERNDAKYIAALSYVKRSKNRAEVLKIISTKRRTPTYIVETTNARFSLISSILSDLKEKEIVICLNEEDKTGRLYELTDIGLQILDEINQE